MSSAASPTQTLAQIRENIARAAKKSGRSASDITLIGAAKSQSIATLQHFIAAGLTNIGDNYLDEALEKRPELAKAGVTWHYIGAIQSNKTKRIAESFDWVHTVDRLKIARRLASERRSEQPLNVCIQLNLDDEDQKAGISEADLPALIEAILELTSLRCRGLMLLPKPRSSESAQRAIFAQARDVLETNRQRFGIELDVLSMGMSGDYEAAILEGSTHIRLGTVLFGARSPR